MCQKEEHHLADKTTEDETFSLSGAELCTGATQKIYFITITTVSLFRSNHVKLYEKIHEFLPVLKILNQEGQDGRDVRRTEKL
jgi:hypothetical protein